MRYRQKLAFFNIPSASSFMLYTSKLVLKILSVRPLLTRITGVLNVKNLLRKFLKKKTRSVMLLGQVDHSAILIKSLNRRFCLSG
jgi:hypothetical protein